MTLKDNKAFKALTDKEKLLVAVSIEAFGDGQHPAVTGDSLPYFVTEYAVECLEKALPKMKPKYTEMAGAVINALKGGA